MDKCKLVDDGNLSFAKHIVALMPEQFHTKDIIPHCIPKPPCYRDNDKPCGRMLSGWRDELNIEKLPGNNPKGALWREKSGRVIHKPTLESSTSAAISGRDKECITCTENKCKNDSAFKKTARIHQLKYRQQVLNASCGETCSDLSLEAAQKGMNLYSDYNVFGKAKAKHSDTSAQIYSDMLRSQHIPLNIFIPLFYEEMLLKAVIKELLGIDVESITRKIIEYAPKKKDFVHQPLVNAVEFGVGNRNDFLNDNTAFDAYIELGQKASKKTILCIEMKYTEQPKTEDYIGNNNADYRTVAEQSNLFVNPKDIKIYESRGFGQMVRNILLAESMMQNQITGINEYRSIILYPKGNSSYVSAIPKFTEFLKDENSGRFGGLTYEDLFSAIRKLAPSYQSQSRICKWVDYLESRYIVK